MYYLGICQCYQLYLIISLYLVPYCPTLQSMQSLKSKQLFKLEHKSTKVGNTDNKRTIGVGNFYIAKQIFFAL